MKRTLVSRDLRCSYGDFTLPILFFGNPAAKLLSSSVLRFSLPRAPATALPVCLETLLSTCLVSFPFLRMQIREIRFEETRKLNNEVRTTN